MRFSYKNLILQELSLSWEIEDFEDQFFQQEKLEKVKSLLRKISKL